MSNDNKTISDILRVKDITTLINFKTVELSKSEKKEYKKFIKKVSIRPFYDVESVYQYLCEKLSSSTFKESKPSQVQQKEKEKKNEEKKIEEHFYGLGDKIYENMKTFIIFEKLLDLISQKRKAKSFTYKLIGSGLRHLGGKIRRSEKETSLLTIESAISAFLKRNKYVESSANFLRSFGEKFVGESATLLRVIRRTIKGENPFLKDVIENKDLNNASSNNRGSEDTDEILICVVWGLLKNYYINNLATKTYDGYNPAYLYIHYLSKYGLKDNSEKLKSFISDSQSYTNDRISPSDDNIYFDIIFVKGIAKFVFFEMRKEFSNEEKFVELCCTIEKEFSEFIRFDRIRIDPKRLTFQEVEEIRKKHFKEEKDTDELTIDDIAKKKEEGIKKSLKIDVFKKEYIIFLNREKNRSDSKNIIEDLNKDIEKVRMFNISPEPTHHSMLKIDSENELDFPKKQVLKLEEELGKDSPENEGNVERITLEEKKETVETVDIIVKDENKDKKETINKKDVEKEQQKKEE